MSDSKNLSLTRTKLYALSKVDDVMSYCDASIIANIIVAKYREFGYAVVLNKLLIADNYIKVCGNYLAERRFISDLQISDDMWNSAAKLIGITLFKEAVLSEIEKLFKIIYCGEIAFQIMHLINKDVVDFLIREIEKTCGVYKLRSKSFHSLDNLGKISVDLKSDSSISYLCSFQNKYVKISVHDFSTKIRWDSPEILLIADNDCSMQISELRTNMLNNQVPVLITSMKANFSEQDTVLWCIATAVSYSFHLNLPIIVMVCHATIRQMAFILDDFSIRLNLGNE
ncbi:hypothetical protein [Candidatus Fokinia crypta]|uniref:Uncharacterized protein n=1 Tax=Candidatus Fokinia crypta TaxID=1920990 RepID=A0ABZ0US05_9RICK|nr:hypothetical protein [Candidatus Fokinia cryptica]WPX98041.1 hypothetical protein Fokcrypt_00569 [Candidatus Fokinia cryptica]